MSFNYTLILGSKSPRREELLRALNFNFRVANIDFEESYPSHLNAEEVPEFLAEKKSEAFDESLNKNEILITADTVVILDGNILGKPSNDSEAINMLQLLSGKTHKVITGICMRSHTKKKLFSDETQVTFKTLLPEEVDYYVRHFKPLDKAGAYGIQEWIGIIGVKSIKGSYFNVVGLPTQKLYENLINFDS